MYFSEKKLFKMSLKKTKEVTIQKPKSKKDR